MMMNSVTTRPSASPVATALRVDMAYLLGDGIGQYIPTLVLPLVFAFAFRGPTFGDGFGYRLSVAMAIFSFAMFEMTLSVTDMQNGYRMRGLIPASRRSQVAARYMVGLLLAVITAAMIALINILMTLITDGWSFTGNLWMSGIGMLVTLLVIAVIVPLGYTWKNATALQVSLIAVYLVALLATVTWNALPAALTSGVMNVVSNVQAHWPVATVIVIAFAAVAYLISYAIGVRVMQAKEW
jgi:Flp pilus assembly pilin Flp